MSGQDIIYNILVKKFTIAAFIVYTKNDYQLKNKDDLEYK